MTLELAYAVRLALLACVLGLVVRGRYQDCWTFVPYASAVIVIEQAITLWPAKYFTYQWYLRFQAIYNVLKFAIATELAFRIFRGFPQAQARMRLLYCAVLFATTFLALQGPFDVHLKRLLLDWEPRVQAGAIWLMTATALLVVWYRLPVTWFQKAILLGFVPYLTVFGTLMNVLRDWDLADGPRLAVVSVANGVAYLLASLWWAYAAWHVPARGTPFSGSSGQVARAA